MTFRDHFSEQANAYARIRPRYPDNLFDAVAAAAPGRDLAWDCGTGNGQAAVPLAARFRLVVATDASASQLAHAERHPRVAYCRSWASASGLAQGSIDAVTVAQALHWFDLEPFYSEVRRVLRPGGILVAWGYTRARITPQIDAIMDEFHDRMIGPWWPPERRLIVDGYEGVPFSFSRIRLRGEPFVIDAHLTRDDFLAYVGTWSAVLRYRAERGTDPVKGLHAALAPYWPPGEARGVSWPLVVLAGRS